jgi:hypothetical protein
MLYRDAAQTLNHLSKPRFPSQLFSATSLA